MSAFEEIRELREERNKIIQDQRAILDVADKEGRDMSADEETNYGNMEKRFDELTDQISKSEDEEKKKEDRLKSLQTREEEMKRSVREPHRGDPGHGSDDKTILTPRATPEYRAIFDKWLVGGEKGLTGTELRALQADSNIAGGYIVAPEEFIKTLIQAKDDRVFMRPLATKFTLTTAASLGAPKLDHDPADSDWTAEIKTGSEDKTMDFEKRQFFPHPVAKRMKISRTLLRLAVMGAEALVRDRLAYKFAITEEKSFLGGTGADGDGQNKPLGVFTASVQGISTSRDVTDGNTTTALKADNLINVKYSIKAQYRGPAQWIFHRDTIKMIRKLKTGEADYVWRAGISTDKPDTILDLPFNESEYAPNTFSSGLYVGLLGDFSFYWIVDCLDMQIQRLDELYAETNQVGFIGRQETDGMPVLEEAFARVKLA